MYRAPDLTTTSAPTGMLPEDTVQLHTYNEYAKNNYYLNEKGLKTA